MRLQIKIELLEYIQNMRDHVANELQSQQQIEQGFETAFNPEFHQLILNHISHCQKLIAKFDCWLKEIENDK